MWLGREERRTSAETKWSVEARLIFQRSDKDSSGAVDFEEFSHAAHGMPVLALGLALFRQVAHLSLGTQDDVMAAAAAGATAAVDSAEVRGLAQAVERAVVGSSRILLRLTGAQRLSDTGGMLGNLLHRAQTEYMLLNLASVLHLGRSPHTLI